MKATITKMIAIAIIGFIGITAQQAQAQTSYQSNTGKVTIQGTSTLHDWDMTSSKGQTKATFTIADDQVTGISALTFTVQAESLKSSKNGLDKNAYKALSTDKHKQITFTMTSGKVTSEGGNKFKVTATGNLNIAGTSKPTTITATGQYNPSSKAITVSGSTKFKMTQYNVKPPTVMMGTIKTGDDITIDYQVTLTP